jgi:hypothetical protein
MKKPEHPLHDYPGQISDRAEVRVDSPYHPRQGYRYNLHKLLARKTNHQKPKTPVTES